MAVLFSSIALASWFAARSVFGYADIRGPFLLISPLYALLAITPLMPFFKSRFANNSVRDPEMEHRFNEVAAKLGSANFEVYLQPESEAKTSLPLVFVEQSIYIFSTIWRQWEPEYQEVYIAYAVKKSSLNNKGKTRHIGYLALFILACFLAGLNLWFIIPLHISGLWAVHQLLNSEVREDIRTSDAFALEHTGDLTATLAFAEWHEKVMRFGKRHSQSRFDAINAKAADLGLS